MPGSMIRRATIAALLAAVGALGLANAASAAVDGQLKQLPGTQGCLARLVAGCGNLNDPITNVGKPAFSPDGLHLYVPDRGTGSVVMFDRNPTTGVLTERSCYSFAAVGGCAVVGASPLQNVQAATVSSDGKSLYVVGGAAGGATDGIAHFTLAGDGTPTFDSCANGNGTAPCANYPVFNASNPSSVAVSPDLTSVYVGNGNSAVVVFKRSTATGALNQVGL
jgi:6-phosphogluconolactonase (cycloisomerase 2 family)